MRSYFDAFEFAGGGTFSTNHFADRGISDRPLVIAFANAKLCMGIA
jgi:hypothetical protein